VKIIQIVLLLPFLWGCWPTNVGFRDTGGMPIEWQKFYMQTLRVNAPTCPLSYSADLTETLKSGILNNTRLVISPNLNDAQVQLSGEITNYSINPIAIQNGGDAAKNRLTVSVVFEANITSPKAETWKLAVTRFADFDANANFATVESQLLSQINEQVVQDVINKLMSNW